MRQRKEHWSSTFQLNVILLFFRLLNPWYPNDVMYSVDCITVLVVLFICKFNHDCFWLLSIDHRQFCLCNSNYDYIRKTNRPQLRKSTVHLEISSILMTRMLSFSNQSKTFCFYYMVLSYFAFKYINVPVSHSDKYRKWQWDLNIWEK